MAAGFVALMFAGLFISLPMDGIPMSTFKKTYNPGAFLGGWPVLRYSAGYG